MRVLKLRATCDKVAKKKTQIYREIAAGTFPRPIRLTAKAVGWVEHELDQYIADKIAARDKRVRP